MRPDGELFVVMTGMDMPPSVADVGSGHSIVLTPAQLLDRTPWSCSIVAAPRGRQTGAWQGYLPTDPEQDQVRLAISLEGGIRFATVTAPMKAVKVTPQPEPKPKRRGRPRKSSRRAATVAS
jgi:hypothetical protein